jgi:pilus assembly protein CpaE
VAALFHPSVFGHDRSESAVLIEALRSGVRDFLRRPVSRQDLEQLLTRLAERQAAEASHGKIVAVVSNKGGVGKSTMAVNIACGLAQHHPERVLLVDLSLQVGLCASMLDLKPEASLVNAARERGRLDETLVRELATPHPSGVHLLAAPMSPVEGSEVDDETVTRVLMLARRAYDFVIVDTFPMVDRIVMAVLDVADRVYIVLENVVPTLLSGVKLIELLDGLGCQRSRQRIVLNRYMHGSGSLKAAEVAVQLGRDVDHVVPFDRRVVAAANMGAPFILNVNRFSRVGRAARGLVREIDEWKEPATNGHALPRNGSIA